MSCLNEIQSLNTLGVNHIDEGDYEEAAEVLIEAVSQLSFCSLAPTPLTPSKANDGTMTFMSNIERSTSTLVPNRIHLEVAETPQEEPSACKDDFYHYPFCFEKRSGEDEEEDDMDMEMDMLPEEDTTQEHPQESQAAALKNPQQLQQMQLQQLQRQIEARQRQELEEEPLSIQEHGFCAATSLYNLALCFHLEWTQQPQKHSLLQAALKYYQEAYNMVLECQLHRNSALLHLTMAICTNAAHCCYHSGQVQLVSFWNQQLCRVLGFAHPDLCHRFFSLTAFHYKFDFTTAQAA